MKVRRYISGDRWFIAPGLVIAAGLALMIAGRLCGAPPAVPPASSDAAEQPSEYKDTAPLGYGRLSEPAPVPFASQASFSVPVSPLTLATTEITLDTRRFPVGSTTRVSMTITGLTDGLAGFDVTLEATGGLEASNIQMPAYGLTTVTEDAGQVRIRAGDLTSVVEGAPGPFELFSFALTGTDRGIHTIDLVPGATLRLDDDSGASLLPQATFIPGEYEVTELVPIGVKFVVSLVTPRSDAQLRAAVISVGTTTKAKIDELLGTDSKTTRKPFKYRLKIGRQSATQVEIYPKLLLTVETVRSDLVVKVRVSSLFDYLKTQFRTLVASDPLTSIVSYHVHRVGGSTDEAEP